MWQAGAGGLVLSPTPFIANQDEKVSLPGTAWRTWVTRWTNRGLTPNRSNVIGGLVQTMADYGFNWCERCDLLALHDKTTALSARSPDPSPPEPEPPYSQRFLRWHACTTSGEIQSWLGPPPGQYQKLNASCSVCPLHNILNAGGNCQPCPVGHIAVVTDSTHPFDHCVSCAPGAPSPLNETCVGIVP